MVGIKRAGLGKICLCTRLKNTRKSSTLWSNSAVRLARGGIIPSSAILPEPRSFAHSATSQPFNDGKGWLSLILQIVCYLVSYDVVILVPKNRSLGGDGFVA